ncbi:MAG: polysaccharide biosynthesis tyrosine autokinase [Methylococcaceae bacterium]
MSNESNFLAGEMSEENASTLSLGDYFHVLWLRRRLLLNVTAFIVFAAVLVIYQLAPRYTAATQLLVGINAAKVVDIEQVLTGSMTGDSAVIGEMEVIKSREIARKVIETLRLDQYPEFNKSLVPPGFLANLNPLNLLPESWLETSGLKSIEIRTEEEQRVALQTGLINDFLSKLTVTQIKRSQVINIAFQSADPKLAAKVTNTIADKYIIGQLQAKFDATKKATDWLNDQLGELRNKVATSEQGVENYRKSHNLIAVSKEVGLSQQQLSEVNSQLIIARVQRAEAEAKYQQVEDISRSGRNFDTVADVLNSGLISSLRSQESEVQRKYSEMLVEFGARHPKMIQMRAEQDDIESKVRAEVKKIAAGLRNTLDVARARESSLMGSLRQLESKTTGNNQDEVELRALERESTANKALFENFLGRFKETASTQGIEQADARVISFAEIPTSATFPKKNMLLLVSLIGAIFFASSLVFVIEQLNPGVRSPEQIHDLFNMATMGIIPLQQEGKEDPNDYVLTKPQSGLAEAINTLRISLSLLNPDAAVKSILITSSVPGEGKSTLATMLARMSAASGQHTVVVEADIRRPAISKVFGFDKESLGLTDLLSNHDLTLADVLQKDPKTGLMILSRGKAGYVNPLDLFASKRMRSIMEELREKFDLVVVDSAPIMAVPDSRILQGLVDKTIYVLKWDSTPKKVVRNGLHLLMKDGNSNLAGIVLQQINLKQYGRYGDYSYYYHYGRYKSYYS